MKVYLCTNRILDLDENLSGREKLSHWINLFLRTLNIDIRVLHVSWVAIQGIIPLTLFYYDVIHIYIYIEMLHYNRIEDE